MLPKPPTFYLEFTKRNMQYSGSVIRILIVIDQSNHLLIFVFAVILRTCFCFNRLNNLKQKFLTSSIVTRYQFNTRKEPYYGIEKAETDASHIFSPFRGDKGSAITVIKYVLEYILSSFIRTRFP